MAGALRWEGHIVLAWPSPLLERNAGKQGCWWPTRIFFTKTFGIFLYVGSERIIIDHFDVIIDQDDVTFVRIRKVRTSDTESDR